MSTKKQTPKRNKQQKDICGSPGEKVVFLLPKNVPLFLPKELLLWNPFLNVCLHP